LKIYYDLKNLNEFEVLDIINIQSQIFKLRKSIPTDRIIVEIDTGSYTNSMNIQMYGSIVYDPVKENLKKEIELRKLSFKDEKFVVKLINCRDTILDLRCILNQSYV